MASCCNVFARLSQNLANFFFQFLCPFPATDPVVTRLARQGEADADAYLAGVETPTAAKKREDKADGIRRLAAYGGVEL